MIQEHGCKPLPFWSPAGPLFSAPLTCSDDIFDLPLPEPPKAGAFLPGGMVSAFALAQLAGRGAQALLLQKRSASTH
jgi:hypothetical protein